MQAVADAPEHLVAEVLEGELHLSPRPRVRHARVTMSLAVQLGGAFDGGGERGEWVFLMEPEFHLGDGPDIVVPDICGWRRTRMPALPDLVFLETAPDWACEVISLSTEHIDRTKKRRIYAREGIGHLWFIDPNRRRLEVYRREQGDYRVHGIWDESAARLRVPPFESFELALADLWLR